jgi:hypothetical protein
MTRNSSSNHLSIRELFKSWDLICCLRKVNYCDKNSYSFRLATRNHQHPHSLARQAERPLGEAVVLIFVPGTGDRIDGTCPFVHGGGGPAPNPSPERQLGMLFGHRSKKGLAQGIRRVFPNVNRQHIGIAR